MKPAVPPAVSYKDRLLPHLVKPLLAEPGQAVWLLPTPEFRQVVVDSRGGAQWGFIGKTGNSERALRNLLERDAMFTRRLREEAQRLGLKTLEVDSTMTVDDLAGRVSEAFGLLAGRPSPAQSAAPRERHYTLRQFPWWRLPIPKAYE
jgi:hypothetical protein